MITLAPMPGLAWALQVDQARRNLTQAHIEQAIKLFCDQLQAVAGRELLDQTRMIIMFAPYTIEGAPYGEMLQAGRPARLIRDSFGRWYAVPVTPPAQVLTPITLGPDQALNRDRILVALDRVIRG